MILRSIARMLLQEHQHKAIAGKVLCLGPQLVPMHRGEVDALFSRTPEEAMGAMKRWREGGANKEPVSDRAFFERFPIESLDSLDVVEGFGGTVIHDLNVPVPASLEQRFDFILDGGTFDHLVNLGIAFESVSRMLKPGGRVFHYNAASGYLGAAYVTFGPDLFYDYYIVNGFADCKVYISRETSPEPNAPWDLFYIPDGRTKQLNSGAHQMVIAIAEKAADSSSGRIPVEHTYRSPELHRHYAESRRLALRSKRPVLQGERPLIPTIREDLIRIRAAGAFAVKRYRAGKFTWRKFRKQFHDGGTGSGYTYNGRL